MAEPHVVTALRAKRAEIRGHVHDLERKLARHRASLAAIDATIRLYAPELNPESIPPKRTYRRTRYFAKGELSRRVTDMLRQASGKPMTTAAISGLESDGNSSSHAPDSHASSPLGIPFGIQMSDAIH